MKKTLALVLSLILTAAVPDAGFALFGLGKKKKEEAQKDVGPLPGLDAGGVDLSQPPRMAQEAVEGEGAAEPRYSEQETAVGAHPSPDGAMPETVEIIGEKRGKLGVNKPTLKIEVDPFESIRSSLQPDQDLLLADSPLTVVWRRTHPEFLRTPRVLRPWLMTFSERPGIVFTPRKQLNTVLRRKVEDKEAKGYQWKLTITDEDGKVFQHYEGASYPPHELVWSGQNDQGEWIRAGRAYSAVYVFIDPNDSLYTRPSDPIRFKGIIHQERDGLHVTLDSAELFGPQKAAKDFTEEGKHLMRSAADLIKRRYPGIPILVEAYAGRKVLAEQHAQLAEDFLVRELMLVVQDISTDSLPTPYADQRLEIVLQNR